ncbi:N-acetylmuramoyl-L-alanine amidase [Pelosinus sp. UFO1]|uniref:N-acetylmuramoyl-L-alanine amidase family protein n=1 Tax=Pelosinus sp. UFO1 TaxID=484770 RepID=UPI0004D0B6AF|nr:N-acetylmuramoyl-L-alanine amidase [Pelosinus sp. UFO1]AIF53929.1 cell wall hydrolase/autolysin [Pelosinus sp. UFO1]
MKITINGGHYPGRDSGAVGPTGLQESDVNCDLMSRVANYLRAVDCDVLEVQENTLSQITDASNRFGADLFISIHCNAAVDTNAKGTETYCYELGSDSEKLAACIQQQIVSSIGTADRGVKTGNFFVLRIANCTAVLVETAFISNKDEEILLADEAKRDQLAAAIARGITDYLSLG